MFQLCQLKEGWSLKGLNSQPLWVRLATIVMLLAAAGYALSANHFLVGLMLGIAAVTIAVTPKLT